MEAFKHLYYIKLTCAYRIDVEVDEHSQVEFWQRSVAYKVTLTLEHSYI